MIDPTTAPLGKRARRGLMQLWLLVWAGMFDPERRWSYRAFLVFIIATWFAWRGIDLGQAWTTIACVFIGGSGLHALAGARTSTLTVIPSEEP